MKLSRIVVDSNIWISFLISGIPLFFKDLMLADMVTILKSDELIDELKTTIEKPNFRKYFSLEKAAHFINQLDN